MVKLFLEKVGSYTNKAENKKPTTVERRNHLMKPSTFATSSMFAAGMAAGSPAILSTQWPGDSSPTAPASVSEFLYEARKSILACVPERGEILARVTGLTPFFRVPYQNYQMSRIGISIAGVPFDVRFITQLEFLLADKISLQQELFWTFMAAQFMVEEKDSFFIRVQRRPGAIANFFRLSQDTLKTLETGVLSREPVPWDSQLWCSDAEREEAIEALRIQVS